MKEGAVVEGISAAGLRLPRNPRGLGISVKALAWTRAVAGCSYNSKSDSAHILMGVVSAQARSCKGSAAKDRSFPVLDRRLHIRTVMRMLSCIASGEQGMGDSTTPSGSVTRICSNGAISGVSTEQLIVETIPMAIASKGRSGRSSVAAACWPGESQIPEPNASSSPSAQATTFGCRGGRVKECTIRAHPHSAGSKGATGSGTAHWVRRTDCRPHSKISGDWPATDVEIDHFSQCPCQDEHNWSHKKAPPQRGFKDKY